MTSRYLIAALAASLSACAAHAPPPPYGNVMTMKANEAASMSGYPPPGTVWRLDEADLNALSPSPIVPAPPPPRRPPPPPAGWYPPPPPWYGPPY
jgi:hypothetical protein